MKIYDTEGFPNPTRVRIALAEKGLSDEVDFIPVDVPNGEPSRLRDSRRPVRRWSFRSSSTTRAILSRLENLLGRFWGPPAPVFLPISAEE